jgi:uncharacterized protein (DUF1684 family)
MKKLIFVLLLAPGILSAQSDAEYKKEIDEWHAKRISNLRSENGWLNVVGLHWLKEGINTFGSAKSNDIIFPKGKAEANMGTFTLNNGTVTMSAAEGVEFISEGKVFHSGNVYLEGTPSVILNHKSLRWFVIKRGERYAIRLRDFEAEALKEFHAIDRFPVDKKWRFESTYIPGTDKKTIAVTNVLGMTSEEAYGGTVSFTFEGKEYSLEATLEGTELFIVFADSTTGMETYGGGRFLYATIPASGNKLILDFNRAYNPPCAFTAFATCPVPMDSNKLKLRITAGEKAYGDH